jgi:hypothetical protein
MISARNALVALRAGPGRRGAGRLVRRVGDEGRVRARGAARAALALALSFGSAALAREPAQTERWYRVEWQGAPAGWAREAELLGPGGDRIERSETMARLKRLGTEVSLWSFAELTVPRAGGAPRLWYRMTTGPADTLEMTASFDRDSLRMVRRAAGAETRSALAYTPGFLRPDQAEDLYRQSGRKPGSSVAFDTFAPEVEAILSFGATFEGVDTLRVEGIPRPAFRWRIQSPASPALESVEWRDEEGNLLRSELPALGMAEIRSGRAEALKVRESAEILGSTWIRLNRTFEENQTYPRVVYEVAVPPGRGGWRPPRTPSVEVRSAGDTSCVVESRRIAPDAASASAAGRTRGEDGSGRGSTLSEAERARALGATLLVESRDPAIVAAAGEITGSERDPWRQAVLLQQAVTRRIRNKDLRVLFGSAAQTLASGEGDCTEHAVLLAALARARHIPARLVAGLVAMGDVMGFHMWTEIDAGSGWIGIDAALNRSPVDGRYLPLAVSDLADDSLGPFCLGVVGVLGAVRVRVLSAESGAR